MNVNPGNLAQSGWQTADTWVVVTSALAAMACAVPGCFLVLRKQSLMGDVLSHTTLPGVVIAFLLTHAAVSSGIISAETELAWRHLFLLAGAAATGVLSALLAEWVQRLGNVESGAALGVVYTTLFALGLLLIRLAADQAHIDLDCVLFGTVDTVGVGVQGIPEPTVVNLAMVVANLAVAALFFKELQISTFDPELATTLGFNSRVIHYSLMAATAVTVVAAFETVGSILVIAMLIVPAATATLLTDRLWLVITLSILIAAASALLGHVLAITLPAMIFSRLGYPGINAASSSGMMACACGLFFVAAMLFAPHSGILSRTLSAWSVSYNIAAEDWLGALYRREESAEPRAALPRPTSWLGRLVVWNLCRGGQVLRDESGYHLSESGRATAEHVVRSHRLWESYLARHFALPDDHLHNVAERVEHYIDRDLARELDTELDRPATDPHGRGIPPGAAQ